MLGPNDKIKNVSGTLAYLAPEVADMKPHSKEIDL